MKNRGTKILILALSITVAIAGILVFWITVVAPPTEVPMRNTHKALLAENINNFKANFSVGDAAANEKFTVKNFGGSENIFAAYCPAFETLK